MGIVNNIKQTYTQNRRLFLWVVGLLALAVVLWFVLRRVRIKDRHAEEIKKLEARNKYLESQNYKDSLYRVDTVEVEITKTNERIIYNTKVYEKIIHMYDTATASEHERYYRTRYGQDTTTNQR